VPLSAPVCKARKTSGAAQIARCKSGNMIEACSKAISPHALRGWMEKEAPQPGKKYSTDFL